nr:replication protein A 70 kDa DNA-binding subunit B-like [Ipomoea batatas]
MTLFFKTLNGEVRIRSSFDATKLFFSHPSKEFVQFSNRYKLVVHVADHTGDALMLIWDRECANLIVMKKDKVESYYSAFTVLRICRDEAVLTQHCWGSLDADVGDGLDF